MNGAATDQIGEFFARLAETPQPLLHDLRATIRIEVDGDGGPRPWHLTLDQGRVAVSRSDAPADAIMRTDVELFKKIVTGEANALTAALRGRLRIEGDARQLVALTRVMPGPPSRMTIVPAPIAGGAERAAGTTERKTGKEHTA